MNIRRKILTEVKTDCFNGNKKVHNVPAMKNAMLIDHQKNMETSSYSNANFGETQDRIGMKIKGSRPK